MGKYVYIPNIVESNGRTVRQNNLELKHAIPLGTLVEVDLEYSPHNGIRMFVTHHSRDCDGSPLYGLYHTPVFDAYKGILPNGEHLDRLRYIDGFSDSCLKVIKKG